MTLGDYGTRFWVESQGADILTTQVQHPVLTVRQPQGKGSWVWLGVSSLALVRDSTYWRSLFVRSLLWSLGYVVKPDVDVEVSVDGKISGTLKPADIAGETLALTIPAGMGRHV